MTPLRQNAMELLEQLPEEKLVILVEMMKNLSAERENSSSFQTLMRLRRPIADLDESRTGWREERNARTD